MKQTHCRFFRGDKPCGKNQNCQSLCPHLDIIEKRILIIHLGALGAVVRSTSLLEAIRRKYPRSSITWVTDKPANQLLTGHPMIDCVVTVDLDSMLALSAQEFDVAFVIDKSLKAAGILRWTQASEVFGFISEPSTGAIVPATSAANEVYELGLSNQKKFFENIKAETQLMAESLELQYSRDPYSLPLTHSESQSVQTRRKLWKSHFGNLTLGINTGCSDILPAKKLSVAFHRQLILEIKKQMNVTVVLLGGPEDTTRNQQIAFGLDVYQSPTKQGLRDGLVSIAACDLILTGDSLGMHMAISQQKWTTAWFGPSCAHEIDFFNHGEAVLTKANCSPCWKKTCGESFMCYDQVSAVEIINSLKRGAQKIYDSEHKKDCDRSDSLSWGSPAQYSVVENDTADLA